MPVGSVSVQVARASAVMNPMPPSGAPGSSQVSAVTVPKEPAR
jgi:hypothetical protein